MTVPVAHDDSAHGSLAAAAAIKSDGVVAANGAANGVANGQHCGPRPEEPPLTPDSADYGLHLPVMETHAHDAGTKDAWVPR